jgi:hypothetical protein
MPLYIFFCLPGFADSMVRSCILEPFNVTILFLTEDNVLPWSMGLQPVLAKEKNSRKE